VQGDWGWRDGGEGHALERQGEEEKGGAASGNSTGGRDDRPSVGL
jgi:hypothetical protein